MSYQRTREEEEENYQEIARHIYTSYVEVLRGMQEVFGVKSPSYVLRQTIHLAAIAVKYADENGDIIIGSPGETPFTTIHLRD